MKKDRGPERMILVAAGAFAVGIHAGLAPDQLREWAPLGVSFVAAATALAVAVAVLAAARRGSGRAASALALVFVGLVVGYVATRVAALPPLDPDREPLDALGAATTAVEAAGLVVALRLIRRQPQSSTPGGNQ
jgi:cytochrome bd-type quinol oxidase subunit 2